MKLYPLFADLNGRPVLVVGGGAVAERKIEALLGAGARVTVASPEITRRIGEWIAAGAVARHAGEFRAVLLDRAWLAVAATSDRLVNRAVATAAAARQIWVNVVDDAELSTFHVPAVIDREPLQIAISSGGGAPMLARAVRRKIELALDESLGSLARLLERARARIKIALPESAARRRFFDRVIEGPVADRVRGGRIDEAERELARALREDFSAAGTVVLVGAGPGDPGLLTIKGLRALSDADVIVHDRLVSDEVLALARRDAERVAVGKQAGRACIAQEEISALLVELARAGKRVVRLKGGDPFVFGRGGEELEALRDAGVPYEVVPGITAALACAAYAGVPLTHRDHAQSVRLVTAHTKDSLDALDWNALAQERQTLAVYMGVGLLEQLREKLVAHGRAPSTPFALVENGSRAEQRVVAGTLEDLPRLARAHAVQSPALLLLGEVAGLAERLAWFGAPVLGEVAIARAA